MLLYTRQEQTARKLKQETMAQLSAKQHKLDMLRNIINQESDSGSVSSRLRNTGDDDDWTTSSTVNILYARTTTWRFLY